VVLSRANLSVVSPLIATSYIFTVLVATSFWGSDPAFTLGGCRPDHAGGGTGTPNQWLS
ncbi:MAG: hypothetical protein HC921_12420, partial [Synechococcaceae cyanobacterium SM2_3_1]|nr:hypothetical protein [Synechococcaceae cyanobacterium SM2_3_1]